mmetsp:Transcript_27660/g.68068  ORF Transcript_27660/g.68068 Transcript_27660/m.68068 type:complete len:790 (-) Transcript_27660:132-2501(-)|eukprot:CAMPEP_0197596648 /NCGR_PEP_ID=MMETSP1326-20131121/25519_1 /TAXON_ID=1155430 /ORGANISM="Genus nov. species nov., Strain RCC2288" /LENGTH=789 /DNA_ID=CAMNT_0043163183 /DNA_START=245 /DNA_END=2617 /DNA_ORIENTATION=-
MDEDDVAHNRFKHLLQPIRDLVGNWNVDIAGELGDYLNDLDEITFTFDGGHTNINFAEAALLIQSSACIYGKKVEYLHALVFQALDFVADKKRNEAATLNGEGNEDDGEAEAAFLSLDDGLEEAISDAIDLDEGDNFHGVHDESMDGGGEEEEVGDAKAGTAAISTARARAHSTLMQMIQGRDCGDGVEYRMSSCTIHPSGAMVLDVQDATALDSRLNFRDDGRSGFGGSGSAEAAAAWFGPATSSGARDPAAAEDDSAAAAGMAQPGAMDDDDNDFGGGLMMDHESDQDAAAGAGAPAPATRSQAQQQQQDEEEDEEEDFDPYTPLDMHDPSGPPLRPFRKGCPGGVKALQKKEAAAAVSSDGASSIADSTKTLVLALLAGAAAGAGAGSAGSNNKAEFAYALQSLECSRRALRQKTKGGRKTVTANGDLLGLGAAAAASDGKYDDEGDEDGNGGGWAGAGILDMDEDDGVGPDDFEAQHAHGSNLAGLVGTAAAALVRDEGEHTYEELCQAHINKFLAAAAAAESTTELANRVHTWKSRIDPRIAEQDAQEHFDIHLYGDCVISRFTDRAAAARAIAAPGGDNKDEDDDQTNGSGGAMVEIGFGDVVAGQEKYQVARLFSAMLQLINNGNIAVEQLPAAALAIGSGALPAVPPAAVKKKKGGKGKESEGEMVQGDETQLRPAGAAYSTLDTGELKLRLLSSAIRDLNITAARKLQMVPEYVPVPALPAPAQAHEELEAEEVEQKPAAAKKTRGKAAKAVTAKAVEPDGVPGDGRASKRTALGANKRR